MSELDLLFDSAQIAYIEVMNVLSDEQHWEEYISREHMLAARRKSIDGLHDIKVEIFFDRNPQSACEYVFQHWIELEQKFYTHLEKVNIYRTFEDGSIIVYEKEKIKDMENGAWAIMGTAANLRDLPYTEGCVRGNLNFMLQLYEPVENSNRCRLLVIEKYDPKGMIPTVIINKEMDNKAGFYESMIQQLKKDLPALYS